MATDRSSPTELAPAGEAAASKALATEQDLVFESAAELFGLLSTPVRLKIISAVCNGERNVSDLLAQIDTTQPNMSQHLATLYRAGVLGRRREGTQIYYRLQSERVATLCRAVCTQVAMELDAEAEVAPEDRLLRSGLR
ncbi:ArsR family transcriptional regulator [beta proteobacterium AAP51]|nr:ArsR family transcriptional regulator [beta proteobacterium AAP51]